MKPKLIKFKSIEPMSFQSSFPCLTGLKLETEPSLYQSRRQVPSLLAVESNQGPLFVVPGRLPHPPAPCRLPCHSKCLSHWQVGPGLGGRCQPSHQHCQPAGTFSFQDKPKQYLEVTHTEEWGVGMQAGAPAPLT